MKTSIKTSLLNNSFLLRIYRKVMNVINNMRNRMQYYENENKLATDNHEYWNKDYSDSNLAQDAHWKHNGKFNDIYRWQSLGKEHLDLILKYASPLNIQFPVKQIVEWGCGGGANAVHFAPLTEKFIGIDITPDSLAECKKQILNHGYNNFHPVQINATFPEAIYEQKIKGVDLFLCTYVYELFPSPDYGLNILKIAYKILRNGGIAFIQIRYCDNRKGLRPKRWGYKLQPYSMTTYTLEEFWENSKNQGFEPSGIFLKPYQPLVNDNFYAYYFLKKKKKKKNSKDEVYNVERLAV